MYVFTIRVLETLCPEDSDELHPIFCCNADKTVTELVEENVIKWLDENYQTWRFIEYPVYPEVDKFVYYVRTGDPKDSSSEWRGGEFRIESWEVPYYE